MTANSQFWFRKTLVILFIAGFSGSLTMAGNGTMHCKKDQNEVWSSGSYKERIEVFFDRSLEYSIVSDIVRFEKWKSDRRIWIAYGIYGCGNGRSPCRIAIPTGWSPKVLEAVIFEDSSEAFKFEGSSSSADKNDGSTTEWQVGFVVFAPNFTNPLYLVIADLEKLVKSQGLMVRWDRMPKKEAYQEMEKLEKRGLPKVYTLAKCRSY